MDDGKLLRSYVRDGSEAAFGQIVTRHRALVYATCLRETGSPSQAEDAAQVVFLLLARKAKGLRPGPSLAGWLFQAARFVAKDVRKQEARRGRREEIVQKELAPRPQSPAPEWQRVEPLLNGALSALRPADRELILLRFLEGHTLAETGAALGLSEDAARMRVTRAVEKMRRWLAAHGASVTGLVLTMLLTAEAARPIPAEAASAVTQGTLHALAIGPTPNVLLLSKGILHTMKIIQVKVAAVAACIVLGGAALLPLAHAFVPHKPDVQTVPAPSLLQVTSAQATGTQTASVAQATTAQATKTQTIVLHHSGSVQFFKFMQWDQSEKLPAGVTKIKAVPTKNALAVTATSAGFATVLAMVKSLDIQVHRVQIQMACGDVAKAVLGSSRITFGLTPLDKTQDGVSSTLYAPSASGGPAIQLLQTLTKQSIIKKGLDITARSDSAIHINFASTLPSGQATSNKSILATPHANSDGSVTLALYIMLSDGSGKSEISMLRTIKSSDTIVLVLPPAVSSENSKNILLFVTPTLK